MLTISPAALQSLAALTHDIGPVTLTPSPQTLANGTTTHVLAQPQPDDMIRTGVALIIVSNFGDATITRLGVAGEPVPIECLTREEIRDREAARLAEALA